MISTIVGSIGGLNQTSIRKILTYTSINHTGWILIALTTSENMWIIYFTIYSTLALTVVLAIKLSGVSFINQTMITNKDVTTIKFIIFTSFLSLGGLPPFLRFLPKWIVIQAIITNNLAPLATIVVVTSQTYNFQKSKENRGRKIQQKLWFPKLKGSSVLRKTAKFTVSEIQHKFGFPRSNKVCGFRNLSKSLVSEIQRKLEFPQNSAIQVCALFIIRFTLCKPPSCFCIRIHSSDHTR